MSVFRSLLLASTLLLFLPVAALASEPSATPAQSAPAAAEKCEHGVKRTLCARCNPKLAAVYKAKGDWCHEHARPESQCAVCKPALEKQGVKP